MVLFFFPTMNQSNKLLYLKKIITVANLIVFIVFLAYVLKALTSYMLGLPDTSLLVLAKDVFSAFCNTLELLSVSTLGRCTPSGPPYNRGEGKGH